MLIEAVVKYRRTSSTCGCIGDFMDRWNIDRGIKSRAENGRLTIMIIYAKRISVLNQ